MIEDVKQLVNILRTARKIRLGTLSGSSNKPTTELECVTALNRLTTAYVGDFSGEVIHVTDSGKLGSRGYVVLISGGLVRNNLVMVVDHTTLLLEKDRHIDALQFQYPVACISFYCDKSPQHEQAVIATMKLYRQIVEGINKRTLTMAYAKVTLLSLVHEYMLTGTVPKSIDHVLS